MDLNSCIWGWTVHSTERLTTIYIYDALALPQDCTHTPTHMHMASAGLLIQKQLCTFCPSLIFIVAYGVFVLAYAPCGFAKLQIFTNGVIVLESYHVGFLFICVLAVLFIHTTVTGFICSPTHL